MAQQEKVPVRECVGAALRFVRENWRSIAAVAAIFSGVMTVLALFSGLTPALAAPISAVSTLVSAFAYAAFTSACLNGFAGLRQRLVADGGRVWGAMAVVGFFLIIVLVVLGIPGVIVFSLLVAPRYGTDIQQASGDETAMMSLMQRVFTENPGMILAFVLFYGMIWMGLTSRLYLSAPASVDAKRILTFETWPWTKGNMWRIIGARAMLLLPAYMLAAGLSYLFAAAIGLNAGDPSSIAAFAQDSLLLYVLFTFVSGFLQFGIYSSLEAGLSAYLYRGLKPATAAPLV